MAIKACIALLFVVFSISNAELVDDYDHFAALDPDEKVKLYWTIEKVEQTVSFALDGATTGWVGFGISTGQGKMDKADMVIGWVKDGKPYLSDRHGVGHYPKIDDHNDYKLISGTENNGRTVIKFSRKIDTCDKQDIKLQEGTSKVIFALNDNDPESPESVMQHTFRGVRSILLLNSQGNRNAPDPSWKHFDILNRNYSVPAHHTTYHCSVHKIPDFKEKNQIVRFDPVVQRGNEGIVHHFIVMVCDPDFPEHHLNVSGDCDDKANMPAEVLKCRGMGMLTAAWGIGGGPFVYPKHVGFPVGVDFAGKHFVMEVHYDNPGEKKGFVDSSGVRFFYTNKIRENDAGVWSVGSAVVAWLMVPPQQKEWKTVGYCRKQCTEEALKNSSLPGGGIKIFSSFLHTHLTGRATWTKHIRNGVELPEIARDDNYDFNFQDIQFLQKEVLFKPGDDLVHTCIYDTSKRQKLTYGGESTREEMCLNFVFYYPYVPTLSRVCTSTDLQAGSYLLDKYYPELKPKESVWWNPIRISNKTWTQEMTDEYRKMIDNQAGFFNNFPFCGNKDMNMSLAEARKDKYQTPIPKVTTPLPKPKDHCDVISTATSLTTWMFSQVVGLALIFILV